MNSSSQEQEPPPDYDCEILLLWAVLERAIQDALGLFGVALTEGEPDYQKDARRWMRLFRIRKEHYNPKPFSYPWICNHLNLNPDKIRDVVEEMILTGDTTRANRPRIEVREMIIENALQSSYLYDPTDYPLKTKEF